MPKRKRFSSFIALNLTQFFTAFNDNFYKLLAALYLISLLGQEKSNLILAIAGGIFVIPFLLFASFSGSLADRYSKRAVIYFTRLLEIVTTLLGVLAFAWQSVIGIYAVLFLLATQTSLFSPSKYGIIVEIVPKERVNNANGIMSATTYLAIITGTFFASFLVDATGRNFQLAITICCAIAVVGALCSLGIEKTAPQAREKKLSYHFLSDVWRSLKAAHERRYLLSALIFSAYFLFLGAYTQLNIIPYCIESLGLSEVEGGYFFLMTAGGIGLGSFIAGRLSGREVELGFVPIGAAGAAFCFWALYFFSSQVYIVLLLLLIVGFFGGFYLVPLDVFIQLASPDRDRGQNLATANFLNFGGVIIASILLGILGSALNLSAAFGFLILSILTALVALSLTILFADQLFRLLLSGFAHLTWNLKIFGKKRLATGDPVVLIGQHSSWLDTLILMASLPRLVRYILPVKRKRKRHHFLYYFYRLIPMNAHHVTELSPEAFSIIRHELEAGHSICLMSRVPGTSKQTFLEWKAYLQEKLGELQVPIAPLHIVHEPPSRKGRLSSLFRHPIRVIFSSPL